MEFSRVADLSLTVESVDYSQQERDTSSGFVRKSTTFHLSGEGETGRGEDVTYDTEDHDALAASWEEGGYDLAGEYTFESFSDRLDDVDLFPTKEPERDTAHHYRRWGLESAGLDLALRQAGESLGSLLGRSYDPVRFVASTRLGEPPTTDRVDAVLDRVPDAEFKLDPTSEWTAELVDALAATDAVRILDIKGQYEGTEVDTEPDADLYRLVFEGFPDAVVEDPALVSETEDIVELHRDRLSWDYPITGVDSVEALPYPPNWLNIKPSRFGTVESLFETLAYAEEHGIQLYGGGQFELDVGRSHIQTLASLCYPGGPNDVAPGVYNEPQIPDDLPASPLEPGDPVGLGF
ncbi:hypothetical protein C2R22_16655 [Salinigranum rubrum]|uniref:Enolase n=1 Tax=Salinigranum rubrum TaxID=755307 RepID=A0A2I8VMG8_9EURY|nr:hypothetical protein [Salinigranum rubrum]AUV83074.1 hypothetical protein C2R22_16655 [Salinigranum rubrum]